MRIGIFSECYKPNALNGVVVSIDTLKAELEKRGHQVFIFTTQALGPYKDNETTIRIPMLLPMESKGGRYPIARPQSVNKWAKIVASYDLDLIHCQHLLSLGSLGLKVARKLDLPKILTYHTLLAQYSHYVPLVGWIARDWLIYKSRQYCNQYDAIISPSPAMQKILVYYGVKTPITAIPTGIDPSHFQNHYSKQDLMTKFQIPPEHDFLFLYVSRVGKEKNVYFLLDAMKKFVYQHNHHNAHLLMIGGGEELEKVKRYCIQLGLSDCVTFAGAQPKDETNKIFGGADAFVFASITETQGIIIQEAQAAGLPVIAVDEMGPGNYINDGEDGLLVPLNSEAFADKMNYLATHPDIRVAMSTKAKENVLKFTAEKCGEKIEEMYERTIANHHRS